MQYVESLLNYPLWSRIKMLFFRFRFKSIGKNVLIKKPLYITPTFICIGDNVSIWPHCRIEGVFLYEGENFEPSIIIGNNVSIQQNLHLTCARNINIGQHTAIAANVTITDIDHPYDDIHLPIERQHLRVSHVKIGEDCKIYNNAVILSGTQIGKHCVVGANSVVKGEFPDYCVIAGIPAKVIRKYNPILRMWEKM